MRYDHGWFITSTLLKLFQFKDDTINCSDGTLAVLVSKTETTVLLVCTIRWSVLIRHDNSKFLSVCIQINYVLFSSQGAPNYRLTYQLDPIIIKLISQSCKKRGAGGARASLESVGSDRRPTGEIVFKKKLGYVSNRIINTKCSFYYLTFLNHPLCSFII